ncbi:B12-binding domain-containing radical SAM protein [Spongiibacter sp. KMU-158]|uniref:B12-binding domain-containing radical SAM protein n=1 Tax=Spongiibacter pelagi TaxID=2760804 RepID=A0A927GWI7_9GAMM|nr:radical SAM protein [Spongiibacter pelagi]MBD2859158.1 B12-binding domain-containing radical SAM protein [Spongiibacter pelagi]
MAHPIPVHLFSMDSDLFWAVPTTTGGLKAYYQEYGLHRQNYDIELVHYRDQHKLSEWQSTWRKTLLPRWQQALKAGQTPVVGFSMYTWNAAEFLELIHEIKQACPGVFCIAGGPHVQQAEDYLFDDPIDAIVLGEGEQTFADLLDGLYTQHWQHTTGIAYLNNNDIVKTKTRERRKWLDELPSALDVVQLTDAKGKPLYDSISYETSRGCPYKCAFCEWGTGAIGGKMYQFSMPRIERDWRKIVAAGIKDIWLADSNFGALKEDVEKAKLICELKKETGLPSTFATSWSKKHSPKVQEIVLLLNQNKLLPHYQLALQTLTPLALELSNRKNMAANKFEPIAQSMAEQGIPIAAELIWGLPGDNLPEFERNLDQLLRTFPSLNIFAYTLLPGTEFYEKREEYQIQTIPVAGYGKAKGEYVVASHTFDREQGLQGYMLITAHMLFAHGHILPLTLRYLAFQKSVVTGPILRQLLQSVANHYAAKTSGLNPSSPLSVYENRAALFLEILKKPDSLYDLLFAEMQHLQQSYSEFSQDLLGKIEKLMTLDKALAPRWGERQTQKIDFDFNAAALKYALDRLELPSEEHFTETQQQLEIITPGGVGSILHDPDGGAWLRGEIQTQEEQSQLVQNQNIAVIEITGEITEERTAKSAERVIPPTLPKELVPKELGPKELVNKELALNQPASA